MLHIDGSLLNPEATLGLGKRHTHFCSKKDKPLVVTRVRSGWQWYCHRCFKGGYQDLLGTDPVKAMAHIKNLKMAPEQSRYDVALPEDFTLEIPSKGLAWLYTFDITDDEIELYKFGYSKYFDRLIMPVYQKDELIYWQGRNLGSITRANPKYLNIRQYGRKHLYFFVGSDGNRSKIVVVEDILSCIKIGRTTDTVSVLSAHVDDQLISRLSKVYDDIVLWLDPDKRIKMMQWASRYRGLGYPVRYIRSDKDPKYYDNLEGTNED